MKLKADSLLLFLIAFIAFELNSFAQYTFNKQYQHTGYSSIQTSDNNFLVAGIANDAFLIKLDPSGDTLWTKTYGGSLVDGFSDLIQTSDGGFFLLGMSKSYGSSGSQSDIFVVRTDTIGNVIWSRVYMGPSDEVVERVRQTSDGGYVIVGGTFSYGAGNSDIYVLKLDVSGNLTWTKTYGSTSYDYGFDIKEIANGYIVTGTALGLANSSFLMKIDLSGNMLWSEKITGGCRETNGLIVLPDGGFVLAGRGPMLGSGNRPCLIRTDSSGVILWSKALMRNGVIHGIDRSADGGFVLTGDGGSIIKTDSMGSVSWARSHPSDYGGFFYTGFRVQQTSDAGYLISARIEPPFPFYPMQIIKTDPLGYVGCNDSSYVLTDSSVTFNTTATGFSVSSGGSGILVSPNIGCYCTADTNLCSGTVDIVEEHNRNLLLIYPNPTENTFNFKLEKELLGKSIAVNVYNIAGVKLKEESRLVEEENLFSIDLPSGVYFISITSESPNPRIYNGEFIVIR